MRILFIIKSLASKHGVERTISDKANYLAKKEHVVSLLTYEQGEHPIVFPLNRTILVQDLDTRFYTLNRLSLFKRFWAWQKMCRLFRNRLQKYLKEFQPDLIVTTTYSNVCLAEIMEVSGKIPVVVESHSVLVYEMPADSLRKKLQKGLSMRALRKCDLLISLTKGDAECWRKYISNVTCLPNPVSSICEDIDAINRENKSIISVGRLQNPKRFDMLIDAFAKIANLYPDWHVDIFGDGEQREKLQQQIDFYGLSERVHLHHSTTDIFAKYLSSQFLVFCSDFESFGLVLIEAMAYGLPVISTNCPYGPSEIVTDGFNGFLVEKNDVDSLAEKMSWMIAHKSERKQMGNEAYKSAMAYKMDVVMQKWEQQYLSVI